MTLGEILTAVREDILEDPKCAEAPEDNLWSDDQLTRYANWAQKSACRRANLLFDSETDGVAVYTLAVGEFQAVLSPLVLFVERVWFDDEPMAVTDQEQLRRCYGDKFESRTGTPQAYYMDNGKVVMFPKPEAGGVIKTRACRLPLVDLSSPRDAPEIDEQYHDGLLNGIAHRAFLKQDSQTLDKRASADQEALFSAAFGPEPSASVISHKRNRVPRRTKFPSNW